MEVVLRRVLGAVLVVLRSVQGGVVVILRRVLGGCCRVVGVLEMIELLCDTELGVWKWL